MLREPTASVPFFSFFFPLVPPVAVTHTTAWLAIQYKQKKSDEIQPKGPLNYVIQIALLCLLLTALAHPPPIETKVGSRTHGWLASQLARHPAMEAGNVSKKDRPA
ncbi:hypothetical protein ACQKWADRAFT_284347 [Trichoderma austrokoningii]